MINIFLRILPFKLFRLFGWPKLLPMNVTVGLTYLCNSRCKTCNIWKKDKNTGELTAKEWDKIFQSLGRSASYLIFTGGEPFLKRDIVEICQSAYEHCQPLAVTIPSNSILGDLVVEKVSNIAKTCPKTQIIVNLSIDELGDKNDEIRGVSGHFQKVMGVFEKLKKLKYKNLTVGLHTVVSKFNVENFPKIADKLLELNPDSYVSEIAEERVELETMRTGITPSVKDYSQAIDFLLEKIKKKKVVGFEKITRAFRMEYYKLVKKILLQKRQVIPCYSGWASAQIAPDGDVWGCCVKAEVYGNLKDVDYNFSRIWFSKNAEKLRESVRVGQCHCPLASASYTNMLFDSRTLVKAGINLL